MKYTRTFVSVLVLSLTMLASTLFAQTNAPATNTVEQAKSVISGMADTAKQEVATNINQVMLEMLSGVKNASGEAYHFSKQEIGKGYDFVKSQAPEVVHEFLMWQVAKAIGWVVIIGMVVSVMFYIMRKLTAYGSTTKEDSEERFLCALGKWIFRLVALCLLIITIGTNGMTIAKICVAPRVYIIEYVMDLYHGQAGNYR